MMETGVVINTNGEPVHWHEPNGRSSGSLPDSRDLWNVLWRAHRDGWLAGVAHSHPGAGIPHPSHEDTSTFVAIERALGRALSWWITSADRLILINRSKDSISVFSNITYGIQTIAVEREPFWVPELRRRSGIVVAPPSRGGVYDDDPAEVEARVRRYGSTMSAQDAEEYARIRPLVRD